MSARSYMLSTVLIGLVAALHFYFLVVEMFLWETPKVRKGFGLDAEFAKKSKPLAMNQGLYNGFLAAGLVWALVHPDGAVSFQLKVFFLVCVLVAGIFGAITANRKIFFVQALPAALALMSLCFRCSSAS